jgi:hypothetical protein
MALIVASRIVAPATVASLVVLSAAMAPQDEAAVDHDDQATMAFACALESLVLVASVCCAVLLAAWLVFWLGRGTAWVASPRVSHSIARVTIPRVTILAIVVLTLVGTAEAATHQVTPSSSDWQSVVSSAAAGDVVEFADGSYTAACSHPGTSAYSYEQNSEDSSMLVITAGITLRAQHPGQAVLDAQGSSSNECRVMFVKLSSGTAEINGLNITGGCSTAFSVSGKAPLERSCDVSLPIVTFHRPTEVLTTPLSCSLPLVLAVCKYHAT